MTTGMALRTGALHEDDGGFGAGLEPVSVLPVQLVGGVGLDTSLQPEKRLMLAVLVDAVATYERCLAGTATRARRLRREVEEWFADDDQSWPCSFVNICHVLGFDAATMRRKLRSWRVEGADESGPAGRAIRSSFRRVTGARTRVTRARARRSARAPGVSRPVD